MQQLLYLASEAFSTLGRHKAMTFLSIVIMSLTLLVLAVFLLATDNVLTVLDRAKRDMIVYVYIKDDAPARQVQDHFNGLLRMNQVETITFISKDQAMSEFREAFGDTLSVLEVLDTNPLPASFRVTLKRPYREKEAIERFAQAARQSSIVEEVSYGKEFIQQLTAVSRGFLYVDLGLGIIVVLSSIFIISNTVRLTIMSRQKSIEVMLLVGATRRFITMPFVIEGAFQAGVASLVSLGLLFGIYLLSRGLLPDLTFLRPGKIALYIATCILLGSIGSLASLRRHLKL